ncbi:MAG: hypothetical protein C0458_05505 [Methylobacterium sp.]|nr:hypothetical protein [Methylobacterium sp.]
MSKIESFIVSTPVQVDITLNDGTVHRLKVGLNHDVPGDVAHHWYAKASGCSIVDLKAADETAGKGKKGKKADEPTLADRAKAVGLDDSSGLSDDEVTKLVEEAEAEAKAGK